MASSLIYITPNNTASIKYFKLLYYLNVWAGSSVGVVSGLRAGRSGIDYWWGRDFPPDQTDPVAHPASCTMGTVSFPRVEVAGAWG